MPARPSSAALNDAFSIRSASGESASISRHHCDRLLLEALERHDRVDEAHVERLLRVVLPAEEPDLLGALLADLAGEQARAEAAVERADLRAGLAEARVVGRDRQVAHDVQHVAAADRVARDHRDDRLRAAADLDLQVEHVEPADALLGDLVVADVAVVAADALVAAGAERLSPSPVRMITPTVGSSLRERRTRREARTGSGAGRRCAPRAG